MTKPLDICTQLRDEATAPYVAQHAADVIEKMHEALEWFIENDDTNEGDDPVPHLGGRTWNDVNAYWIDGLNKSRAALAFAESRDGEKT
jgi:hypothetical protein